MTSNSAVLRGSEPKAPEYLSFRFSAPDFFPDLTLFLSLYWRCFGGLLDCLNAWSGVTEARSLPWSTDGPVWYAMLARNGGRS